MILLYNTSFLLSVQMPGAFTSVLILLVLVVFVVVLVRNRFIYLRIRRRRNKNQATYNMIEQAIKTTQNDVVHYVLRDGMIYNLYGHLYPDPGISVEEWKKYVHPEDFEETLGRFRQLISGETARDEFYYRWDANMGKGEPKWNYLHNVSVAEYDADTKQPSAIISTLWDEGELKKEEQEGEELAYKYQQIFENSIIGLSFYTPDGWLLNSNKMMREICHFDSEEADAFFSNMNLFELSPFRECCDKDHLEELWICHQSVVPERDICDYLETRLHPILDDVGNLIYIAIASRNVSEEREMYQQAKLNDTQIQKANEEIQRYEEELRYMMEACRMRVWRSSFKDNTISFYQGLSEEILKISFHDLADYFVDDRELITAHFANPSQFYTTAMSYVGRMKPVFGEGGDPKWIQLNSIPLYDEDGQLTGAFGLIRNINNLMEKQEQLKQETERANDAGRLKSVFLANMTHEIRTPLNAIVGFTDVLQLVESPDDKRELIRLIHNNCDMLLRLINDILVLTNVDANNMEIKPVESDIVPDFDSLCQTLAQRVQEPGVEFIVDNPYERCVTYLDNDRMDQVLTNFVTNAVKYTHQGHIRLDYRIEERHGKSGIYAYCEDTGSGIPKDQCERIFERFVKLNDFIQGTGIGLSICKAIIEKCEGDIGVESEVDQGSTFWFWVPAEIKELKVKENA